VTPSSQPENTSAARKTPSALAASSDPHQRLADAVASGATLDEVAANLLQLFADAAGASIAVLKLREGDTLRTRAALGLDAEEGAGFSLSVAEAFAGMEPLSSSGVLFWSREGDGPWSSPGLRAGRRGLAVFGLALRAQDSLVGAIYVAVAALPAERQRALESLASPASAALSRSKPVETLEQALRARDDLLAAVAHDLRNPISVIKVSTDSLLRNVSDPGLIRSLERVSRAARRADRLIRDLLDINAIESGRFNVDRRKIETTEALVSALDSQQGLAAHASVILSADLSPELPPIEADEERLLQVLENLIGNAVKFTRPGGVVTVGAAVAPGEVTMTVRDQGPGIEPDQVPRLFDRFWRAGRHDRRGTGLGLAICKAIVEAHGGRIWVESRLGEGTTMSFTLPAGPPGPATERSETIFNVLLVDDQAENILALRSVLQHPRYRLLTASSGEEALRLAVRERIDVALIDVAMPGMDGVELAGHMKALERCRDVPIIFVTAFGHDSTEIHRAYEAGGADYLVKPLDANIVRKKVAVFASLHRRQANASGRP
jgi:signal transduction histidine kinase/ActR/RegA family two-component response regulator